LPFDIHLLLPAQKTLEKLDGPTASRIIDRLDWLSRNLEKTKLYPLKGDLAGLFKLREGHYRIFYQIIRSENTIIVHTIGHRRDVYKRR
jgi:mRNA interferase RelE/StbE